jgi:acylpyruvate hydrolase
MKLATCELSGSTGPKRFIAGVTEDEHFADLGAVSRVAREGTADEQMPESMIELLERGEPAFQAARSALDWAQERLGLEAPESIRGPDGERLVYRRSEIDLLGPVPRPGKIMHTSCNFDQHLSEIVSNWKAPEWTSLDVHTFHHEHPTGFLQAPSAVVGSGADIIRPRFTQQLDYEIEIATVIGRRGRYISQEQAMDHVAGFCVFNDISARDIQSREHANRVILLGKSFDTSAPLGPYLVTRDELADPQNLDMELRVNGKVRQKASTADMHYKIRDLVAWWSNITLEPGDVITSGSPAGVAAAMSPPKWLEPGDRIEATIEGLGTLVNTVVESD